MTTTMTHTQLCDVTITRPSGEPDQLPARIRPPYREVYVEPPYEEGPAAAQEFVDRWTYSICTALAECGAPGTGPGR